MVAKYKNERNFQAHLILYLIEIRRVSVLINKMPTITLNLLAVEENLCEHNKNSKKLFKLANSI